MIHEHVSLYAKSGGIDESQKYQLGRDIQHQSRCSPPIVVDLQWTDVYTLEYSVLRTP